MIAMLLWAIAIGAVAYFWDVLELRWIERRRRKYFERTERAWREWYKAHPCKRSDVEPWLGTDERRHAK